MAQASRRVRKTRRLKREKSIAFRMLDLALNQRDQARMVASALSKELDNRDAKDLVKSDPAFEMTTVPEPDPVEAPVEQDNPTN